MDITRTSKKSMQKDGQGLKNTEMTSDQRLFLMEFLVSKIKIESSAMPIPQFQTLTIHLQCGNFLDVQIIAEEFGADRGIQAVNGEFRADMGKTCLFPFKTIDLVRELNNNVLNINLLVSKKLVGSSTFKWRKEFVDMVQIFELIGVVKSVNYEGAFDMLTASKQKVASIVLSVKMSCLGESVDTYLNLQGKAPVFINAKTQQNVKCDKYEFTDDKINPVMTIYNPVLIGYHSSATKLSWNQLFGGKGTDAKSIAPVVDDGVGHTKTGSRQRMGEKLSLTSAYDVVSMCFRPPENKFLDFLNMLSAEVKTRDDETIINIAVDRTKMFSGVTPEPGKHKKRDQDSLFSVDEDLTEERLNRKLCCNNDCEALQKFYQYGIGPKYKPSGLGCYYEIDEPSTSHGMYHVFENFSRYGPTNFYRRPKDPYQNYNSGASRYHGRHGINDRDLCYCAPLPDKVLEGTELCCCCLQSQRVRLRGGGKKEKKGKMCSLCRHIAEKHPDQLRCPLRLRGGGIIEKNEEHIKIKAWDPVVLEIVKQILDKVTT